MFLKSIFIQNFAAIENMTIDFKSGVNLLIGDNGVGKSSIINSIAISLGGFMTGVTGVDAIGIPQSSVRFVTKSLTSASEAIEYSAPVKIKSVFDINGQNIECERVRNDENGSTKTTTKATELKKYATAITNDVNAVLPIISYQSIYRGLLEKTSSRQKNKFNDRRCGYIGCLSEKLDINEVKQWCLSMEMESFKQERKISEYEAFKNTVSLFMKKMNKLEDSPVISYSKKFDELTYSENNTSLPITCLSSGYKSLLSMIMDIAFRLALLNPMVNDLCQVGGIILVDEVDSHLHPKWQWNIITALEETFPNIQFIITTHSPIVISSCKNENLIMINNKQEIMYLPNAYGYSIQDVIELRQESCSIPQTLKELSVKFEVYLNDEEYGEAKRILEDMTKLYGKDNSEVRAAKAQLELEGFMNDSNS